MTVKVVIVVTSHAELGTTGNKTGWYLPEVAHPCHVFKKAGYDVTFVSPKGGKAPMDPGSAEAFKDDPVSKEFLNNKDLQAALANTKTPTGVQASDFRAILFAGGHGPMFDMPDNTELGCLAASIYENGGVVSAVCHGTAGLIPVKLSNGESIVKGQKITCFTDAEEEAVKLTEAMPFLLEKRLREMEADFVAGENFKPNVQVSGRIVTGQNPASATPMAEKIVSLIKKE